MRSVGTDESYTIEELARLFDLPSSTIRLYQTRGLLPPPSRQGRRTVYGPEHVRRLRQIHQLKDHGYSLAAIGHLFRALESGLDLADVLSHPELVETIRLEPIDPTALTAEIFGPETTFDPELFRKAAELGLVEIGDDGTVQVNRRALELGAAVIKMGIPPDAVLDELDALLQLTDQIALRFRRLFEAHLATSEDEDSEKRLVALARQVVDYALRRSLARVRLLDNPTEPPAQGS